MSMSKVSRAFSAALTGKAASEGCTMIWERGDDGKKRQRLTCGFARPSGERGTVTGLYEGSHDLEAAAYELASRV